MNELPNEKKESIDSIRFIIRHYRIFLITVLGSAIMAAVVTFFIPKEYLAYAIVFPAASNSLETTVDSPMFGYDVEADRLIQVLQSKEMFDSIVKKYNLINYYELDITDESWPDKLREYYSKDVIYKRNISMSVEISAQTKDPELSANIVNSILGNVNSIREKLMKKNLIAAKDFYQKEYNQKNALVDSLVARISAMRDEVKDPEISIISNQTLNMNINSLKTYKNSTVLEQAINRYYFELNQLNEIGKKYEKAASAASRPVTEVYVLDKATVSHKKVYPSYTMNIIITACIAFILTWIVLFLAERTASHKKEL
ncbi:MAG: Wzz/FepE/Etk N-terminal domain-containing protein [Bacteroidota bacterium]